MKLSHIILVMIVFALLLSGPAFGASFRSHSYSSTFTWEVNVDSTACVVTESATGDTTTEKFLFTQLGIFDKVVGYMYVEYIAVDTNAAGNPVDTAEDTMHFDMYTYCKGVTAIKKIIDQGTLVTGGGGNDTVWFTIPADSNICDAIYFNFLTSIFDTNDSSVVGAGSLGVTYKATVKMTAK